MAELKGRILAGMILVKAFEAETKTASGIIIPDSAKEKPLQGKVVLTGKDKKDEPMEVKVGDTVFYQKKYQDTSLNIDGEDYLLISQSDVMYILG
ncbi:MAG: co-chaperone GroES [Marinifilaceae bacterium]|jgi:chaperonin GroES|nr:co-chaperone GroES [Marinifilaceae bacterium]